MARDPLQSPSPPPRVSPLFRLQAWLRHFTGAIRTRILLLYAITMLCGIAASVPVFRFFLFNEVNKRVRADLLEELETFQAEYTALDTATSESEEALIEFIDAFLAGELPEDDNFHIILLDGELYQSNPRTLPSAVQPGSEAMQKWLTLREPTREALSISDTEGSNVIYKTSVLEVNDNFRGKFVVAHLADEERAETLAAVSVFLRVATVAVGASFLLAWLGSRQLLKPIQRLAETTQGINESNLSQRLEVQDSGELAVLASTFNAMMDRVQNAFDSQRNFIHAAGHELRTPITIIQGHLELMDDDPEEQEATINLVMDELNRMGRFINDLILLAKAERPDFLQLETIDLESFVVELFNKVTALGDRDWQLSGVSQGRFVADRQRITAALVNLALNATQHTQPTDTIELGSTITQRQVRFWVSDSGEGIASADQQRIFERFTRGTNNERHTEGSGLGLAIVQAIADAHGGYVELNSQLGAGATFSLILPIEPS